MNRKTPLRIWLLAGVSSLALAALVVALSTRTVHANAPLAQAAATLPPAAPVTSATPSMPTAELTAPKHLMDGRTDRLKGIASWYGAKFHGRTTASGERFDMNAMTACHSTLPFGSLVRVINCRNKRSVVVRITDRGDLVDEGRIIDLSYRAAEKLAMTEAGLAKVELEVLSLGKGLRQRKPTN